VYVTNRLKEISRDLFINELLGSGAIPNRLRTFGYKIYGMDVQSNGIRPYCKFWSSNIQIGKGTTINYKCFFANSDDAGIEIGENCDIAPEVMLCTFTHEIGASERRGGIPIRKPIKIGNGCWVGTKSTILPGVTIGDGCIIAAGSIVTKDCQPNGLYAGIPAKRIRNLACDNGKEGVSL